MGQERFYTRHGWFEYHQITAQRVLSGLRADIIVSSSKNSHNKEEM